MALLGRNKKPIVSKDSSADRTNDGRRKLSKEESLTVENLALRHQILEMRGQVIALENKILALEKSDAGRRKDSAIKKLGIDPNASFEIDDSDGSWFVSAEER